ncbi:Protein mlp1 [Thecaphora frezii]
MTVPTTDQVGEATMTPSAADTEQLVQQPSAAATEATPATASTEPPVAADPTTAASDAATTFASQLILPPSLPMDQLAHALMTSVSPPPFEVLPESRIRSPDAELILYTYSLVLQLPSLRDKLATTERELAESKSRDALLSESMVATSKRNDELEQALAQQKQDSLQLVQEKEALAIEIANLKNQLDASSVELENEKRQAAVAKEDREKLEAELSAANNQLAAFRTEAESERKAKELLSSEKDRLAAELTGVSAQLSTLRSSSESGVRHVAEVRGRLEQVEQEKRDILSSLQREREDSTRKAQEIDSLLKRNRDARQEISKLSSEIQECRSRENFAKFKLQGLEQELQLTKKDAEWANDELIKSNEASAIFRSAKRLEIASLQSDLDAAKQQLAAAQSKTASLQATYDDATHRLNQSSSKVAELQSRLASQEASFRSEMSTQTQLAELWEKRAAHATARIEELEEQWEGVLHQCRLREEAAWKQTEAERAARKELETQKEELSLALDRLADGVGIGKSGDSFDDELEAASAGDAASDLGDANSRTSTPAGRRFGRSVNGSGNLSGFNLSTAAAFAVKAQRSGKTFSQVYMELAKTQEELRREKLECARLSGVLAQVMEELQDRAPQLRAQREETERLERDLDEMLKQVAASSEERDEYRSRAERFKLEAENLERENGLLLQQLGDFGRQVRELTKEIIIRDDPTAAQRLEDDGTLLLELEAAAPIPEDGNESDTQAVITAQLVTFRSLSELCAQNARLLQVTRQLGAKMEEEERSFKAKLAEDENRAVGQAKELILRLEEEVRAERYKNEEVTKERDMFRHLCATGGRGSFAGVAHDETNDATAGQTQDPMAVPSGAVAASSSEYEALRNRYESLKDEHDAESRRHRDEAQSLRSEISNATISAAREKAAREAIEERYATLQRSYELQRADLTEASKRAQALHESLTRKDLATHAAEEQAIQAQAASERLRTQVATLQAEKELWKATEAKLLEENRSMLVERGGLQELVRNTQTMQAELEARGNDARARLEQEVKRLQESNEELKTKVNTETEMYRQLSLRREVESKDLHSRIDLAATELSNAREALAIARTSADQTQLRVEDLNKQLEAVKEKLNVYERREQMARDPVGFQAQPQIQLSREEQLEIELADLKAGRAAAQVEVQQARIHVEQSQQLLHEKEAQLEALKGSYEEHRAASESTLNSKAAEIAALQTQVRTLTVDLTNAQKQSLTLQDQLAKQKAEFLADKKSLEDAIAELGSVEERAKAEQEDVRSEIRKHIKSAKEAEARLAASEKSKEALVAESTEAKEQLEKARQEASTLRSQKDRAEAEWGREKSGWESLRQGLEKEKVDLQRRIEDLNIQNQILHTHLETISAQANEIRQAAAAPLVSTNEMEVDQPAVTQPEPENAKQEATDASVATGEAQEGAPAAGDATDKAAAAAATAFETADATPAPATTVSTAAIVAPTTTKNRIDELHEVIKYLRREKEIVDLQMELNKQETARLKQSLDHANKTLDETRSQLSEERSRTAGVATSAGQHAELLEKIGELNSLREANATLRDEADKSAKRIAQLDALLATANGELQPLREQLINAQVDLESCQAQLNMVQEDNKRWQARAQGLLQTHGIGEEMKKVEEQKAEAQKRVDEVEKQLEERTKETETVRAELQTARNNFEKLREQVRARISTERRAVAEWQEKAANLQKEKDEIAATLAQLEANVNTLTEERNRLQQELEAVRAGAGTSNAMSPASVAQPEGANAASAEATLPATASNETLAERQQAIEEALQAARKEWDDARALLESQKAEAEKARDKHHQKGKEFLRNQRAAEAMVKQHEETIKQLKEEFASNHSAAINRAVEEMLSQQAAAPAAAEEGNSNASLDQLKAHVAELEQALEAANARIQELEAQLATQTGASGAVGEGPANSSQEVQQLRQQLRKQESELTEKYAAQQKAAVEESFLKGKASVASGGGGGESALLADAVEEQVQQRLKAVEDERESARQQAIKEAVDAKERELKAQFEEQAKARFEAGKNEANLRNQLIVKQRDNRIAKLQAEIAELKGEAAPGAAPALTASAVTAAPAAGAASNTSAPTAPAGAARPSVFGRGGAPTRGRGGGATATTPPSAPAGAARPTPNAPAAATTAIRGRGGGTAAGRGGRGGAAAARGGGGAQTAGAKRKLSTQGAGGQAGEGTASNANVNQAGAGGAGGTVATKKQRAAGGPVPLKRPGA